MVLLDQTWLSICVAVTVELIPEQMVLHQSIEDLAIFRTLPNVIVMHPCDDVSTRVLTNQLVDTNQPSYTHELLEIRRQYSMMVERMKSR